MEVLWARFLLGVPKHGCFNFYGRALLQTCVCALLCSFALFCVFLRPTAFRTTAFERFRFYQAYARTRVWHGLFFGGMFGRKHSKITRKSPERDLFSRAKVRLRETLAIAPSEQCSGAQ